MLLFSSYYSGSTTTSIGNRKRRKDEVSNSAPEHSVRVYCITQQVLIVVKGVLAVLVKMVIHKLEF
jgi:hypothetical protein